MTKRALPLVALLTLAASASFTQTRPREAAPTPAAGPWFGVPLPPKLGGVPAVLVGPRGVRPAIVPQGEAGYREFEGKTIRADLETIVGFAKESRTTKEIGSGQLWGRVTGFPSSSKTINWAADQFRKAGIKDVKIQPMMQEANARLVLPLSWEF